jgi:hypothetical protein
METQLLLLFFFCCCRGCFFFAGRWRKESVHDCYKKRHNFQLSETHPDNVAFPSFRLMLSVFWFFEDSWTRVYVSKRGFSVEEFSNFCRKQKENGNYSWVPIVSPLSIVVNSHIRFPPVPSQRFLTTILVRRKEVSCLSAGGDNSLQRLTNLEEEPGVVAAVAGGEGLELATHRQPP